MSTIDARMAKLIEESSDPYYLSEDVILDLADRLDPVLAEHGYTVHADSAEEYLQAVQEGLNGDDAELSEIIGTVLAGAGGAMLGGIPGAIAGVGAYHAAKHGLKYLAKPGAGKREWDKRSLLNKAAHGLAAKVGIKTQAWKDNQADIEVTNAERKARLARAKAAIGWHKQSALPASTSASAPASTSASSASAPASTSASSASAPASTSASSASAPASTSASAPASTSASTPASASASAPASKVRAPPKQPVTPANARQISIQNRNKFLGAPASKPGVRKKAAAPVATQGGAASKPGVRKKVGPPAPTQAVSTDKAPSKPKVRKPKQPAKTSSSVLSAGKAAGGI